MTQPLSAVPNSKIIPINDVAMLITDRWLLEICEMKQDKILTGVKIPCLFFDVYDIMDLVKEMISI